MCTENRVESDAIEMCWLLEVRGRNCNFGMGWRMEGEWWREWYLNVCGGTLKWQREGQVTREGFMARSTGGIQYKGKKEIISWRKEVGNPWILFGARLSSLLFMANAENIH